MNPTEHLTREQRIGRIGELLSKAVTLMVAQEMAEMRCQGKQAIEQPMTSDISVPGKAYDDTSRKIIAYIMKFGSASPRDIQSHLAISKATVFRRFSQFENAGIVVRSGSTRAVRYCLVGRGVHSIEPNEPNRAVS